MGLRQTLKDFLELEKLCEKEVLEENAAKTARESSSTFQFGLSKQDIGMDSKTIQGDDVNDNGTEDSRSVA